MSRPKRPDSPPYGTFLSCGVPTPPARHIGVLRPKRGSVWFGSHTSLSPSPVPGDVFPFSVPFVNTKERNAGRTKEGTDGLGRKRRRALMIGFL